MNMKEYDGVSEVKSSLRSAFAKLMTASKDMVSEAVAKLISRLNTDSKVRDNLGL
jgi:mannose-6-phosphate isomerase